MRKIIVVLMFVFIAVGAGAQALDKNSLIVNTLKFPLPWGKSFEDIKKQFPMMTKKDTQGVLSAIYKEGSTTIEFTAEFDFFRNNKLQSIIYYISIEDKTIPNIMDNTWFEKILMLYMDTFKANYGENQTGTSHQFYEGELVIIPWYSKNKDVIAVLEIFMGQNERNKGYGSITIAPFNSTR